MGALSAGLKGLEALLAPLGPLQTTSHSSPIDSAALEAFADPGSSQTAAFFRLTHCADGFLANCHRYGQFQFDARATHIDVWRDPRTAEHEFNHYMNSAIAAILFELRGALALHASAVVVEGGAHLLLGDSGAGKSTVAATLLDAGADLLADDITPVSGQGTAYPGQQRLRLPRRIPDANRRASSEPHLDKHLLDPPRRWSSPIRVASITLLGRRREALCYQRLDARESWRALWGHGYAVRLARRVGIEARRLDASVRLATQIPIYRLHPPQGLEKLAAAAPKIAQLLRASNGAAWDTPSTAAML